MSRARRGKIGVEPFEDEINEMDDDELEQIEQFERAAGKTTDEDPDEVAKIGKEIKKQSTKSKREDNKKMATNSKSKKKQRREEEPDEDEVVEEEVDEDEEDDDAPELGFAPFIYAGEEDTNWTLEDLFQQVRDGNDNVVIYDVNGESAPVWFRLIPANVGVVPE